MSDLVFFSSVLSVLSGVHTLQLWLQCELGPWCLWQRDISTSWPLVGNWLFLGSKARASWNIWAGEVCEVNQNKLQEILAMVKALWLNDWFTVCKKCCAGFGWSRVNLIHGSWCGAVFLICAEDRRQKIWSDCCLSSQGTVTHNEALFSWGFLNTFLLIGMNSLVWFACTHDFSFTY